MSSRGSAWILAVAGLAGACSMTLELSAVRLVAPWFGTSSVVWTHVIGVVLLALSVGYWMGARLSRGANPERTLGIALLLAAGATAWLPALAHPVASWFRPAGIALDEAAELLQWGSLAAALVLFLPPTLLLGCAPPLATEILQRRSDRSAGDSGGRVLALSTLGSIAGTFSTTYLVLPALGLTRTYLGVGVLLALTGIWSLVQGRGPTKGALGILLLPLLVALPVSRSRNPAAPEGWRVLDQAESAYQSIRIVESLEPDAPFRRLQVNEGLDSFQSVWQPEPGLLPDGYYYNLFVLPVWWSESAGPWRVFVAGLGAGTAWRVLEGAMPAQVRLVGTGAEIDPEVVAMGRRWFDLPASEPDRRVLAGWDARAALASQVEPFEEIVLDAYANQMEIPAHLCTLEFFEEVESHLAPAGWLAVNIGGFGLADPVVESVAGTVASAFGTRVLAVRVPFSRNCILFARRGAEAPTPGSEAWFVSDAGQSERLSALSLEGTWRWFEAGGIGPILTDDENPIDALQWESIRRGRESWISGH
ncbi:MAG: spermidine synthase [Planctomycetota bacterium]